ncbi:MAG: hypothetical protein ACRCS3_14265 [Paracoccaceae bacterium]
MTLSYRLYTAALIGLSGAVTMLAMGMGRGAPMMVVIAGVGALLAGLPVASLFGHEGREGVLSSIAGAVMATGLGAMMAGFALALTTGFLGAVLLGPVAVATAILTEPVVMLAWVGSMAGVHVLTRIARSEAAY